MHVRARLQVAVAVGGTLLTFAACGGGRAARARAGASGVPPALVQQLQVPENPYRIIYSPPVNLAKPPDTTAHGRKPPSPPSPPRPPKS